MTREYARPKQRLPRVPRKRRNAQTEKALQNHPFVKAAERGRLPFQPCALWASSATFKLTMPLHCAARRFRLAAHGGRSARSVAQRAANDMKALRHFIKGELWRRSAIVTRRAGLHAHGRSEGFFAPEPRALPWGVLGLVRPRVDIVAVDGVEPRRRRDVVT